MSERQDENASLSNMMKVSMWIAFDSEPEVMFETILGDIASNATILKADYKEARINDRDSDIDTSFLTVTTYATQGEESDG